MAIGDGIRRNAATLSQAERDRFREAILEVNRRNYPDGVSHWFKQDQIHQATHVHGGPAFLPWHRELCNQFEELLRQVDPGVSLHYWDWTTDPRNSPNGFGGNVNLMSSTFMGSASGGMGAPFGGELDNNGTFAGSRNQTSNPADPPRQVTRSMGSGTPGLASDSSIITSANSFQQSAQWNRFRGTLEGNHNSAHVWIGGTIGTDHTAFEDPFVYMLHSNVDRLWAMWQIAPSFEWRLDPAQTYGNETNHTRITENLQPWAGGTGTRPWAAPDNQQYQKNSLDPTIVTPPVYDTMVSMNSYNLSRAGNSVVRWQAPDHNTYNLNVSQAVSGQWLTVNDTGGRPVMAYRTNSGQDGELVLSLDGAPSILATLLHNEDDFPRKYYYATDGGNNNPLRRPAFIIRSEGVGGSPIQPWGSFKVLCL